jgi:retron-type reverse transcriptase
MSQAKIGSVIDALRAERYRWTPVRRVRIAKSRGGTRPLGLPTWSDKLVQEVIRMILEAYYEPQFSPRSHGFRPRRGCHTALREIHRCWTGTTWFIEGDISSCFDSLDHGRGVQRVLGRCRRVRRSRRAFKTIRGIESMDARTRGPSCPRWPSPSSSRRSASASASSVWRRSGAAGARLDSCRALLQLP